MDKLTNTQIDRVLRHLPVLHRPDLAISDWIGMEQKGNILTMGMEVHSTEIRRILQDLRENGFVIDADWGNWQKSAERYWEQPELLKYASLGTLQKVLTTHVRKDHFCEGHFSEVVRSGHLTAIIERLAEIRLGTKDDNPWVDLPKRSPFVLPEDKACIENFNLKANDNFRIHLEIIPEPYLGNWNAPVVLLALNPGFKDADLTFHANPRFSELSRANLLHKPADYPFYLLDPSIDRTKWWDRHLRRLIDEVGCEKVANNVLCVEFFPYHSRKFRHTKCRVPSQEHSFELVRQAIERDAVILLLRGRKQWVGEIPELENYRHFYIANTVQNAVVSPGNFPTGFKAALDAIRKGLDMGQSRDVSSSP